VTPNAISTITGLQMPPPDVRSHYQIQPEWKPHLFDYSNWN